jgi:hypothetical protein
MAGAGDVRREQIEVALERVLRLIANAAQAAICGNLVEGSPVHNSLIMQFTLRFSLLFLVCLMMLPAQQSQLGWSSYLRGGRSDTAVKVLVEPNSGDIWIGGHSAGDYEAYGPNEPFQLTNAGRTDIFLLKLRVNPDGSATPIFFTWLGGADVEELADMKFDEAGRIVLTGITNSLNFPMAGAPFQNTLGGDFDVFVSIVDPNAGGPASLVYSTYYGGSGREIARAVAVGADRRIAVVGNTTAEEIPNVRNGAQPFPRGNTDAFVIFFVQDSTAAPYATYLGGEGNDTASSVVIDRNNWIWLVGSTGSADFPLAGNSVQTESSGFFDAFLAAFDPARPGLDAFVYGSYLGGSGSDEGRALALDQEGRIWITGITFSRDLPVTERAAQREFGGGTDAFVMRLDPALTGREAILYSTYVGGTGFEFVYDIQVEGSRRAVIGGYSMQGQLPVTSTAVRRTPSSPFADGMVAVIDAGNIGVEGLEYLTYVGGSATDVVTAVDFDAFDKRSLVLVGYTNSGDLTTTDGSVRQNAAPAPNAFGAKIIR